MLSRNMTASLFCVISEIAAATCDKPVRAEAMSLEQPDRLAVPAHDQPVAVTLDLGHPAGLGRRLDSEGGNAGLDKARGKDASPVHPIGIAACRELPQPPSCR
jgi:hypothetical protein